MFSTCHERLASILQPQQMQVSGPFLWYRLDHVSIGHGRHCLRVLPSAFAALVSSLCHLASPGRYGWEDVGSQKYNGSHKKKQAAKNMMKIFIVCFLFSFVLAQVLMHIMMRFGGFMIHISLLLVESLLVLTGVLCARLSHWYLGFFFFVCAALTILFHYFARYRIAFAAATLHVGCEIVLNYLMLQLIAFIGVLVAVGFFFIFALAIYGFYNVKTSKNASAKELVLPILVFILVFLWTEQVFRYITVATTARRCVPRTLRY